MVTSAPPTAETVISNHSVPTLWPASTVVILATGPSLSPADVEYCRGKARVLAIKDAVRLAPWADALYACDGKWWRHYGETLTFPGPRYALEASAAPWATVLRNTGPVGLELDPTGLKTGKHSGYQAINLAVHFGAARIVLLGFDMQPAVKGRHHFFGDHPWHSVPPYGDFLRVWPSIVEPLHAAGVSVVNATRTTALTCFPCLTLTEALA